MVSGPSGVGKGSVVAAARSVRPDLRLSVSVTTRPPRVGEVDGESYHFVSRRRFRAMVEAGDMLEHAEFSGQLYGTPRSEVLHALADGATVVLEIELEGARQVKAAMPEALTVFLEPPSMFELASRLRSRGTEDADEVDRRLRTAEQEIAAAHEFDAVLVNTDIAATAQALLDLLDASAC
ncbi:MAG: guanylate kinase [Actinomycetota bacterium]|nr:guanylate kinase [Actinomycetota bacterium]